MPALCLYFKVHQPFQLKQIDMDIKSPQILEDIKADKAVINCLADECYLPANKTILSLITQHNGAFKVTYSISGTALELFSNYRPDVIDSFVELVETGCVEILGETYY